MKDVSDTQSAEMPGLNDPLEGVVKWFDPLKGFGFVVADAGGADILLHVNVLRNFGQSSVADGARVTVRVQQTDRGAQAVEVLAVTPPVSRPPPWSNSQDLIPINLPPPSSSPPV